MYNIDDWAFFYVYHYFAVIKRHKSLHKSNDVLYQTIDLKHHLLNEFTKREKKIERKQIQ